MSKGKCGCCDREGMDLVQRVYGVFVCGHCRPACKSAEAKGLKLADVKEEIKTHALGLGGRRGIAHEYSWQKTETTGKREILPCMNTLCELHDYQFGGNCSVFGDEDTDKCEKYSAALALVEGNTGDKKPEPAAPETAKRAGRFIQIQIPATERNLKVIDWVDKDGEGNRRGRSGQIMTLLENLMKKRAA